MSPLIVNKDKKKREILEAAMAVFAQKGYRNARMADVADSLGIGKGTIYEYFESKEDLFFQLFEFIKTQPMNLRTFNWPPRATPSKKLKIFILTSLQAYHQLENFIHILFDFQAENRGEEGESYDKFQFGRMYKDFRREVASIIKEGIQDGSFKKVDPDYIASIIISSVEGLMFQWLYDRRAFSLKKMGSVLTDMILNNIKA